MLMTQPPPISHLEGECSAAGSSGTVSMPEGFGCVDGCDNTAS